jgi:dodecin
MTIAKVSEITSSSAKSFDDAIEKGIKRASKTIRGIQGAWLGSRPEAGY